MDPVTPFGTRLLQAIDHAGWTQTSFETAAGYARGRVSRLLTRPQTKFDTDVLRDLRDMLDVRVDWLLWGEEPMRDSHPPPAISAMRLAHRLGTPYRLLIEVRNAATSADGWDEAQWLAAYQAAGSARAKDAAFAKAKKRADGWKMKREARYHGQVEQAKAAIAGSVDDEPKP